MGKLLHLLAHLLGWHGCEITRDQVMGHEWLFATCVTCGSRRPLAHSVVCTCPPAAGDLPRGGQP
jgi:hypothetical protein